RFAGPAGSAERCFVAAAPGRSHGWHAIRRAAADADGVQLEIVGHPRIGAWGCRTLHLLRTDGQGVRQRWVLPLRVGATLVVALRDSRGRPDDPSTSGDSATVAPRGLLLDVRVRILTLAPHERLFV